MKRQAIITVSAKTRYEGEESEKTVYTVGGTLEDTPDGWRVTYAEPEEAGMAGTETQMDILSGRVELTRAGAVRARFVFAPDRPFHSVYETPYGNLNAAVYTRSLRVRLGDRGGLLELKYELELGGTKSAHDLILRARAAE